ncbi:PPOX class F420-dependent oxidoreductase [Streptomyces sp. XM4011]|uniref:PPOX class F420-dependent oxidoreductase n=1 Tax=Streptomyces sp. XM4011 TaxID=2929780 RepID=UPI001FFB70A1|nr:PPOX class F420-dependent oxidoreductase [Streptomyces sp. XM4011]MCK1815687.1 PPOX class F420-dependent oxidoreductase [Streptomyces sp. XM4011]
MTVDVPSSHLDILHSTGLAFVATLHHRDSGVRPQVSPTWFHWDESAGHLLISLTDRRQKYRNLRREPAVAVCLTDPANPYRYIELRGSVVAIDEDHGHRLIDRLASTYVGVSTFDHRPGDGQRLIVRIAPDSLRCFG